MRAADRESYVAPFVSTGSAGGLMLAGLAASFAGCSLPTSSWHSPKMTCILPLVGCSFTSSD